MAKKKVTQRAAKVPPERAPDFTDASPNDPLVRRDLGLDPPLESEEQEVEW